MKCRHVQKRLSAFQDGELNPLDQGRVSKHLEDCPACRERYEEMEKVWQALGDFKEILPEPGFYGQVVKKINESYEPRPLSGFQAVFQLFSSVAGCSLLIAGVLVGTLLGNVLARSDLSPLRPTMANKSPETFEAVSFRVFDPVPPGTLGDGYIRMVGKREIQSR